MKISYRSHSAVKFLDSGIDNPDYKLKIYEGDKDHYLRRCGSYFNVLSCFNSNIKYFKKSIKVLTQPVVEAMDKSREKLYKPELIEMIPNGSSGTFINGSYTFCYSLGNNNENVFFVFKENNLIALIRASEREQDHITFFSENTYKQLLREKYSYQSVVESITQTFISVILFLRFAEIETKMLQPNSKVKEFNCKYVNDTNSTIEIIDSTWFTSLVKSDSFKVRGHFRLQAFGEGLKDRKLKWINEFMKDGYTAPARKLNQQL